MALERVRENELISQEEVLILAGNNNNKKPWSISKERLIQIFLVWFYADSSTISE